MFVSTHIQWVDRRLDVYGYPSTYISLSDYTLIDFYAEYNGLLQGKLKIYTNAKNLTNTKFTEVIGYNTMGANFNVGLKYHL